MYKNLNEDIFDGILRSAFCEYAEKEMKNEPSLEELNKRFPIPKKEIKRIKRKIKEQKYRSSLYFVYFKRAAVAMLCVVSVSFALLATNDKVRAAVADTFIEWYDSYVKFDFSDKSGSGKSSDMDISKINIGYIPDGFDLKDKSEFNTIRKYNYTNGTGEYLFIRICKTSKVGIMADKEYNVIKTTEINGYDAYILESDSGTEYCSLIFGNDSFSVFLDSTVDEGELIKIAENIKK